MAYIEKNVTFEDVINSDSDMVFYAVHTCWWTHNPNHLYIRTPPEGMKLTRGDGSETEIDPVPIPTDPRGSVLMQTDDVEGFLKAVESDPGHCGKHGLDAFMAAHHENCFVSKTDRRHTSLKGWDAYNKAIDQSMEIG